MPAMDSVSEWLEDLGLGQYAHAFKKNDIEAQILTDLSDQDLEKLGVASLGHRKRILRAIAKLRPTDDQNAERIQRSAQANPDAERRQLTVMFVDMVGSTAMSGRLDPEDMRELLRAYQDACSAAIARYDGYVAKFMGDGVLAYFGYPVAHEDDAERAVNAGLGVVAAIDRLGKGLEVRVGIETGTVVVGDLIGEGGAEEAAVTGETPNLAARLQEIARSGEVVIGAATHSLTGGLFACAALGELDLKGFSRAVRAWTVSGARQAGSRFQSLHGTGLTRLVSREEEVEILLRRWQRTTHGEGQVVLISGEPGIGKSRLALAIEEQVGAEHHECLRFQCSPYLTSSALHPVIEHLKRAAQIEPGDPPATRLDKLDTLLNAPSTNREEAGPLFAELLSVPIDGRYPPLNITPQRKKELTLEVLMDRLLQLAQEQSVLFSFEDAHWIDPTSQELLDLVTERIEGSPIMMVVTYRPEYVSPWIGRANVTTINLNRLDRRASAAMAERVSGDRPLPADVLEQIVSKTDGVPLFVEELTKSVLESGLLTECGGGHTLEGPLRQPAIPTTLQDSLEARLDRLGPAKEVAQIGATIGREFDYRLLAAVAAFDATDLDAALDGLVNSELAFRRGTRPDAKFTFKHALVRDAAYESLLRSRRQELHGCIADCLKERFPDIAEAQPEVLAQHYFEAGDTRSAIEYWKRAGEKSSALSANSEAIAHLRRGLELVETLDDTPDRARLELDLQLLLGPPLQASRGWGASEP